MKYSDSKKYVGDYVLLLQISYLHRPNFRGISYAKSLPLIKHWNNEKLKKIIDAEVGEYGVSLSDRGYPLSFNRVNKQEIKQEIT